MRVYIIKHKGKCSLGNFIGNSNLMELKRPNGEVVGSLYSGDYFYRLKDAKTVLKYKPYKEFYEIVSAEIIMKGVK